MVPLLTPLQPQISAESGMAATFEAPPRPESPMCIWPNRMCSRISDTSVSSRIIWKYHGPSSVSPYITAPRNLLSRSTSFLYTPRAESCSSSSSSSGLRIEIARREQIDAGHLELGGNRRALVAHPPVFGQMIRRHLGLLEQRRDQPVNLAAMLHAFAYRIDLRVVGLHRVVHHDTAIAMNICCLGQCDVGPYARRHDHQVGRDLLTVLEAQAGHLVLAPIVLPPITSPRIASVWRDI